MNGKGEVQGIRSIIGRHKIDRGRLRIAQEMEKLKNLHGNELRGEGMLEGRVCRAEGG